MKSGSIFAACFLVLSAAPSFALTVISDIDDTLKISNVLNPAAAATRALANTAFTGMPETLQGVDQTIPDTRFIYVSARPSILGDSTERFLSSQEFPEGELFLKTKTDPKTALAYKTARVRALVKSSKDHFILIGDDTQADPEAYAAVAEEFPGRIDGIYIRQITGRNTPPNTVTYLTAYDIAANFEKKGLISAQGLEKVILSLIAEPRLERVLPKFQKCPLNYDAENTSIKTLILSLCQKRKNEVTSETESFTAARVLIVGDSHTGGPFGQTLDTLTRSQAMVQTYGSCGSTIDWWYSGRSTVCGLFSVNSIGVSTNEMNVPTPKVLNLVQKFSPDKMIIALGTNYVKGYTSDQIKNEVRRLVKDLNEMKMPCVWVGPPDMRNFREVLPNLVALLRAEVSTTCTFIDSREFTHYTDTGGDGTHFGTEELRLQAKRWAEQVNATAQTL